MTKYSFPCLPVIRGKGISLPLAEALLLWENTYFLVLRNEIVSNPGTALSRIPLTVLSVLKINSLLPAK